MFLTYVAVSLVIGMFMTYIWSSNGFTNTLIKVGFTCYTLWTAALLLGLLWPRILAAMPNASLF